MSDSSDAALREQYANAVHYIRLKIDQLLALSGGTAVHPEALDDEALIAHDPIGIIARSFGQTLDALHENNRELAEAHREIRALLNAAGAAIVVTDGALIVETANPKAFETLLVEGEGAVGRPLREALIGCRDMPNHALLNALVDAGETTEVREIAFGERCFHVVASPVKREEGGLARLIFVFTDITELKRGEDSLRLFFEVFNNAAEAVLVTDRDTRIVAVNDAFTAITGYSIDEVRGKTPGVLKSDRHSKAFYRELWGELTATGHWRGEIWDRGKRGEVFPVWQSISAVRRPDGSLTNYVSIWSDISSLKETQQRLDYLAHHDALTGLANRCLFLDRLGHALTVAERGGKRLALLFIDLDGFKETNDTLGHAAGDQLLIEVAERIRRCVRRGDTVARFGGDEFTVLVEGVEEYGAVRVVCEKLVAAFATPCLVRGEHLNITLSIGAGCYPRDGRDGETLLKRADAAMYEVKKRGRNGYRFYTRGALAEPSVNDSLEEPLREALRRGGIEVRFQPQVLLDTRRVVAAEALARWEDPLLVSIPPRQFVAIAERGGMIGELGEAVLRSVCGALRRWLDGGLAINGVSVNTSSSHLREAGFAAMVERVLGEYGIPPALLTLEIPEESLSHHPATATRHLARLRGLGVQVVIDDFGADYSVFGRVGELPVDGLKIGRTLVRRIAEQQGGESVARAVGELAKGFSLGVAAAGIETERQHATLASLDGVLGQGYLYGRELTVGDFERLLSNSPPH